MDACVLARRHACSLHTKVLTRRDQIELRNGKEENGNPEQLAGGGDATGGAVQQAAGPAAKAKAKRRAKAKAKGEAKPKATPKKRGRKALKGDADEQPRKTPERRTLFDDVEQLAEGEGGVAASGSAGPDPGNGDDGSRRAQLSPMAKRMARSSPKAKAKGKAKAKARSKPHPLAHLLHVDPEMAETFKESFKSSEGLPFDDLKMHLVNKKAAFNKCALNAYWSRVCCGVKLLLEPAVPEVAYFAYKGGGFNARLAAAYTSALLMVSCLFRIVTFQFSFGCIMLHCPCLSWKADWMEKNENHHMCLEARQDPESLFNVIVAMIKYNATTALAAMTDN